MLFEGVEFPSENPEPDLAGDHVFRYCTFNNLDETLTGILDSEFLSCTFLDCIFYWTVIPADLFYDCRFERCTFCGAFFGECIVVNTVFIDCTFKEDNLGGKCDFYRTKWFNCKQENCIGLEGLW